MLRDYALAKDLKALQFQSAVSFQKQETATDQAVEKIDKIINGLSNEILLAVRRATAHLRQKKEDTASDPSQITDPNEKQVINTEFIKVLNTKASQDNLDVLAE